MQPHGIPVLAIATLDDPPALLMGKGANDLAVHHEAVAAYRRRYGAPDAPPQ